MVFFLMIRRPPRSPLFPYATLFRSRHVGAETIDYTKTSVAEELRDRTGGRGPDRCIEAVGMEVDRKSTRLNSSHANISYAVFCLKKIKLLSSLLLYLSPAMSYFYLL